MVIDHTKAFVLGTVAVVGTVLTGTAACQAMDQQQDHHKTKVAKQRIAMIRDLVKDGMTDEEAEKMVNGQLDRQATGETENSAVNKFCMILRPLVSTVIEKYVGTDASTCELVDASGMVIYTTEGSNSS